jgi:hypothetical protein
MKIEFKEKRRKSLIQVLSTMLETGNVYSMSYKTTVRHQRILTRLLNELKKRVGEKTLFYQDTVPEGWTSLDRKEKRNG